MKRRLDLSVARAAAILPGALLRMPLPAPVWMPDGNLASSVIVGRTAAGGLVAYANLCRHQPVALDSGGGGVQAPDGAHLLCHSHGALYRPSDGLCVAGPCLGQSLFAAQVVAETDAFGIDL